MVAFYRNFPLVPPQIDLQFLAFQVYGTLMPPCLLAIFYSLFCIACTKIASSLFLRLADQLFVVVHFTLKNLYTVEYCVVHGV